VNWVCFSIPGGTSSTGLSLKTWKHQNGLRHIHLVSRAVLSIVFIRGRERCGQVDAHCFHVKHMATQCVTDQLFRVYLMVEIKTHRLSTALVTSIFGQDTSPHLTSTYWGTWRNLTLFLKGVRYVPILVFRERIRHQPHMVL
jgi:hypothetical protein